MIAVAPRLSGKKTGPASGHRRWRTIPPALLAALLLLITTEALAGEAAVALDPPRLAQAPEPLCFCWNDGRKIAEGLASCIRTTQGRRVAQCGRVINMMSWHITDTPCPES